LIGLCTALEQARFGPWDIDATVLDRRYSEAVQRAGGIAVLLPPDAALTVDPATYGAEKHAAADEPRTERDEFEIALAKRAMERDIPVLGVCRGMQVMNVARGGTLVQHLPEHVGNETHRRSIGTFDGNDHPVRLAPGSLAARATGEEDHGTLSHHHQGIERVGDGLQVSGWSDDDDLPEALEDPGLRFALGVQWHPEADPESPVIAALVEAARRG
jgi:putative glutamine amidotransferase